jgi:integrase
MSNLTFDSVQAASIEAFIDIKHAQGYAYDTQIGFLHRFDRFLSLRCYGSVWLDHDIVSEYVQALGHLRPLSQMKMLSVVRIYSRFLHLRYPKSYVVNKLPFKANAPSRFYIFSAEEIATLMQAAGNLEPAPSIRPHTVKTLIGLLYVSGLRISEALALNVADLDVKQRTLFVRKGKFGKDRYVPLTSSSVEALLNYLQRAAETRKDQALFITVRGTRVRYPTMDNTFRGLVRQRDIGSTAPLPRLHDLRHTYAVGCVYRWYEQGRNVNALLPVLSTVMGHVKVSSTQVYLHVPDPLRQKAAERFRNCFKNKIIPGR